MEFVSLYRENWCHRNRICFSVSPRNAGGRIRIELRLHSYGFV